jgi:NAD(P)-dependent dehydrogenase (short-subunit alcohol dehydrogenase family)
MTPRTAVVTGGASGIGAAVADRFEQRGDTVVVLDRNAAPDGRPVVVCDLADPDSVVSAVSELPPVIDVLVNAAGVSGTGGPHLTLAVNFSGLRSLTTALLPRIVDGGAVVNVASTAGWFWRDHLDEVRSILGASSPDEMRSVIDRYAWDGYAAYAHSKEAVIVWTAVAAQENLGRIRCNSVSPGITETPLLAEFYASMGHAELDPLTARAGGRNGTPDEVAAVIDFLASEESSWVNGTDVPVDHGSEAAEFLASQGLIPPIEIP